jgi:hypothetical protein
MKSFCVDAQWIPVDEHRLGLKYDSNETVREASKRRHRCRAARHRSKLLAYGGGWARGAAEEGLEIRIGGIWTRRKSFAAPVLTFGTDVNLLQLSRMSHTGNPPTCGEPSDLEKTPKSVYLILKSLETRNKHRFTIFLPLTFFKI